uniref:Uncharacterized protein n=1 Tax=candidate division CPR3 bacterium TaxID=2268181 RepID=A0A7V3N4S7_UNCC3
MSVRIKKTQPTVRLEKIGAITTTTTTFEKGSPIGLLLTFTYAKTITFTEKTGELQPTSRIIKPLNSVKK